MSDDILLDTARLAELGALAARSGDEGRYGLTDDLGFIPKPYQQLVAEGFGAARQIFGDDVDLANGAILRKLIELNALSHAGMHATLARVVDDSSAVTARGAALSRIGEELGLPRPYLRATGVVTLKALAEAVTAAGTPRLTIKRGTRLQSSGGTYQVFTDAEVQLAPGQAVPVGVTAFIPGPTHNLDHTDPQQRIVELNLRDPKVAAIRAALEAGQPPFTEPQFLEIEHSSKLSGGNLMWDDVRYRELILTAPRSVWTPEAIQFAVRLVPGVVRAVVADEFGGLDIERPIFGNFIFGERVFGHDRDIFSPYALKVHIVPEDGAIWEGEGNLQQAVLAAIEDLRPLGIFADVDTAREVRVAVGAKVVVATPPGAAFKPRLMQRLDKYIGSLSFGEPVRAARLVFAMMEDPNVVDVQELRLHKRGAPPSDYEEVDAEVLQVEQGAIARFDDTDAWLTITT